MSKEFLERKGLPQTSVCRVWLPWWLSGKTSTCNAGDPGLIPGSGSSPGEGDDYPLQYPGLENSMDCIVNGVEKSWTRLSHFHFSLCPYVRHSAKYDQHIFALFCITIL